MLEAVSMEKDDVVHQLEDLIEETHALRLRQEDSQRQEIHTEDRLLPMCCIFPF